MTNLKLEKRGMPFSGFHKDCIEAKNSDFDNFRYYGLIEDGTIIYHLELTIHERQNKGKVLAYLDFSKNTMDGCKGCPEISGYCEPYQKDVLDMINSKLGTNYTGFDFI